MIPSLGGTRFYTILFCVLDEENKVRQRENKVQRDKMVFVLSNEHLE